MEGETRRPTGDFDQGCALEARVAVDQQQRGARARAPARPSPGSTPHATAAGHAPTTRCRGRGPRTASGALSRPRVNTCRARSGR
jgi:hypothetical protein